MKYIIFLLLLAGCAHERQWTHETDHSYKHTTYWGEYGTTNGN